MQRDETSLRLLEDGVAFGRPLADQRASAEHLVFVRLRPYDVLDASEAPLTDAAQGGLEARDGGAGPQPDERALRGHLVDLELLDLRIEQRTEPIERTTWNTYEQWRLEWNGWSM